MMGYWGATVFTNTKSIGTKSSGNCSFYATLTYFFFVEVECEYCPLCHFPVGGYMFVVENHQKSTSSIGAVCLIIFLEPE